jgi:hypothetical protein
VRNHHELGECRPFEECVVCHFKIGYLKLHVFSSEVFLSPKGHGKTDLADGGHHCSRGYAVEGSLAWMQRRSGDPHLVKGLQEQDVQGAPSIDEDSVELDILDDGPDNQRVPT